MAWWCICSFRSTQFVRSPRGERGHVVCSTEDTLTTLRFLGAAETVTGSRYLIESARARVLVDCGLFQGLKRLRLRNWEEAPFEPAAVDAVVLTHAHIDHAGYLPRLCTLGFRGPVYCTPGTRDLLGILLPDSGHLHEEEARQANRRGYSRHHPALPLYTRADAERCLEQLVVVPFGERFTPAAGLTARFGRAGHIIGAAWLSLDVDGTALTFSGDVGRPADPIMRPPELLPPTDVLVVESTYGDRRHPDEPVAETLARVVREAAGRGGPLIVPAFAVGRAQHLLHLLGTLRAERRIPDLPIFLDSPMAIDATDLFYRHGDDHRLSPPECERMRAIASYTRTTEESKTIDQRDDAMIVVAASGMATGGRVLHHLARFLPDQRATVLLVGYQTAGTRGRALLDGTDEVKIHGRYVPVRAKVMLLETLSAHADHAELVAWLRASAIAPRRVFVTHGEPAAADAFRRRLHDTFGWQAIVPTDGASFPI
jgi:metallo-beta-lactamase family protein